MFELPTYIALLNDVDTATTSEMKGSAFEALCEYLFNNLEGVEVMARDALMESEEIDLVLWNAHIEEEFRPLDDIIFVECKNWTSAVGAQVLDSFIGKLRRRQLKTGIFIAANGVTGAFNQGGEVGAKGIITHALQDGYRVITLTMQDLRDIGQIEDLKSLIKRRFCGIFLHKVLA